LWIYEQAPNPMAPKRPAIATRDQVESATFQMLKSAYKIRTRDSYEIIPW
jgi:hypothetical protein